MIPEIGSFALVLALLVALVQGSLPLIGAQRGIPAWIALARPASSMLFLLIAVAFGCLTASFTNNDFSVVYVAQHSNSRLPLEYRISGVWGGHEGSLLLWVLMLSLWSLAVAVICYFSIFNKFSPCLFICIVNVIDFRKLFLFLLVFSVSCKGPCISYKCPYLRSIHKFRIGFKIG